MFRLVMALWVIRGGCGFTHFSQTPQGRLHGRYKGFVLRLADQELPLPLAEFDDEGESTDTASATGPAPLSELSRRVEESILSQYDERVPAPPKDLRRVLKVNLDLLNWHAASLRKEGRLNEAVKVWQRCLRLDPHDARAWLQLAKLSVNGRNFEKAQKLFDGGIYFCPDNAFLLQAYGVYKERRGHLREAEELYRKGIQVNERHAASWLSLGLLSANVGDQETAGLCLCQATLVEPTNYVALQARACHAWDRLEDVSTARDLFRKSLQANPKNVATYQAWACREAREGNLNVAAKLFQEGDKCYEQSDTFLLAAWAELEAARDNDELAESLFQRCLRRVENLYDQRGVRDAVPYQMYGNFLRERSQYGKARQAFDRGTQINRASLPIWSAWALMEANLGETEEARRLFELGLNNCRKSTGKGRTFMYWALLELQDDNVDMAKRLLSKGLRADPQDKGVLMTLAMLEEREGRIDAARRWWELARKLHPTDRSIYLAFQEFGVRLATGDAPESTPLQEMGLGKGPSVGMASVGARPMVSREVLESRAQSLESAPVLRGLKELDDFGKQLGKGDEDTLEVKILSLKTTPRSAIDIRNPRNFGLSAGKNDADALLLWRDLGFPNSTAPATILPA